MNRHSPTGMYLRAAGVALALLGVILFFATAGFPPAITTTYEYTGSGMSTTRSPSDGELAIFLGLFLVGAVLIKAGQVAGSR